MVKLALMTKNASLPRLTASIATTLGGGPKVTVNGIVNDGLFGVFFILKYDTAISPLPVKGVGGLSLDMLVTSSLLL